MPNLQNPESKTVIWSPLEKVSDSLYTALPGILISKRWTFLCLAAKLPYESIAIPVLKS